MRLKALADELGAVATFPSNAVRESEVVVISVPCSSWTRSVPVARFRRRRATNLE
jgi:hypothetical protein